MEELSGTISPLILKYLNISRFLGMSEELKEIVALLGAMRRKKGGKVRNVLVREGKLGLGNLE